MGAKGKIFWLMRNNSGKLLLSAEALKENESSRGGTAAGTLEGTRRAGRDILNARGEEIAWRGDNAPSGRCVGPNRRPGTGAISEDSL